MKLTWAKCPCLHPRCDRQHPTNLGTFTVGTGFNAAERELLDRAMLALEKEPQDA